jgi:hypothetical protein
MIVTRWYVLVLCALVGANTVAAQSGLPPVIAETFRSREALAQRTPVAAADSTSRSRIDETLPSSTREDRIQRAAIIGAAIGAAGGAIVPMFLEFGCFSEVETGRHCSVTANRFRAALSLAVVGGLAGAAVGAVFGALLPD